MSPLSIFLWVAVPYAAAATFVVGHIVRNRSDQFGWTTRSSQIHENRLLRWGSPMFHLSILMVIAGHVVGLLIPREWLYAIGISEHIYHLGATWMGTAAAVLTLAGLAILLYRRRVTAGVRRATTVMDRIMYAVLAVTLLFGTAATVMHQVFGPGDEYRGTIGPWMRGLMIFQPQPELMADVPVMFQLHVLCAMVLFVLWPFTRLVHVFSAPIGYFIRPRLVYRTRYKQHGARATRRGWEPSERPNPRR
ncbi:respiratory nitrate reductase subunit gamma [Mycetocola tolaasinivorans]|uniref:Nitrate reductase-like protein NarX n=1 Tax=Mycetocola tolaasinivorans TaxID=76635 RepID=A0A3L7A5D1_9MICO|nr:respiratory nitrate reductase subunit gamma [Mycetocola tolaasinivorans]RLP75304.1 respiratory nitrate reductase subunit gamma [Mycetocola tolaasinivorans]